MRWFLKAAVAAVFLGGSGLAQAQDVIRERRFVVKQEKELPGGDIGWGCDTTREGWEREALTNPGGRA